MTSDNFIYWLNGYLELSGAETLTKEQVKVIKDHLKLVLKKETPAYTITQQNPWPPFDPSTKIC